MERRKREQEKVGEKNPPTCFSKSLKCLADVLSDSEVRGDDGIDRFYLQVVTGGKKRNRLKQLVMQKSIINHHFEFELNEI